MAAMTGQLLADFSDFTRAVDTATVTLKSFESGAGKVEGSLNRMVDNFSGRKVIQDATLMAEAVEKIGGSSKLTDAELQKVGATAEAAAFKLRAMGQAVPSQLEELAKLFKGLDETSKGATTSFTDLVNSFVTAQAIIAGAEKAFDAIVALVKEIGQLAMEGAAVSDVAGNFQHLTEEAGRLGDTLLGALRTGTHNTITDFELMKVANKDLAAGMVLTDAQFATLARGAFALAQATGTDVKDALDTMNDAMLTGRGRALAMLTGKIDLKAAEEAYAVTLGTTADRLADDEKLYADRQAMLQAVGAATDRLGEQTDGLDEHVAQAQTSWNNFRLSLGKTIAESKTLEAGFNTLRTALIEAFGGSQKTLIDAIALAIDKAAIVVIDFALGAIEGARLFNTAWSLVKSVVLGVETGLVTMAAAATEAYAKIAQGATYLPSATDETRRLAAEGRAAADSLWNLATALDNEAKEAFKGVAGHSAFDQTLDKLGGGLLRTRDAMVAAAAATGTQTEAMKGAAEASRDEATATLDGASATGKAQRAKEDYAKALKEIAKIEASVVMEQKAGALGLNKAMEDSVQRYRDAEAAGIAANNKLRAAEHDFILQTTLSSTDYKIAKVNEAAQAEIKAFQGIGSQVEEHTARVLAAAKRQADGIIAAATNALDVVAKKGMDTLALLDLVARQVQKGMAVDVVGNAAAVGGSGVGMQAPIYVSPPIYSRDAGGPGTAGQSYYIGTGAQPELFTPSTNGVFTPNSRSAGVVQNIVINVNGTAQDVARQVSNEIMRAAMRGAQFGGA